MIYFECPDCKEELSAPSSLAGEVLECPVCRTRATVPRPADDSSEEQVSLASLDDELYHPNPDVRVKAVMTLGKLARKDDEVVRALVRKFRDHDRNVRDAAMRALLDIGQPEIVGMLVRELGGHWSSDVLLREAIFDLTKFGRKAAGSLIEILNETVHYPRRYDPHAVRATVMLLGEWKYVEAIPLLAKMFRSHFDLHVRDEAAYCLALIGKPAEWKEVKKLPAGMKRTQARNLAKAVMEERNIVA